MITVIGNLKGGTGKSTVTFNLAVWLCLAETDVVVIDLDPQQTLTDVAELRLEERFVPSVFVKSGFLPNKTLLDEAEETLIDVGNSDMKAFTQAISIADRVLIPVTPSQADVWSTQRFVQLVHTISQGELPELVALINRADTHRETRETSETATALVSLPGVRLLKPRLCERSIFRSSFSEGLAVFEMEPWGKGSHEFKTLAATIFAQKNPIIEGSNREEHTPDRMDLVARSNQEESLIDPTITDEVELKAQKMEASPVKAKDGRKRSKGEKKKDKRVKKGNKTKKGKRDKKAKEGKKAKKTAKGKNLKKKKKTKKAKKIKKG